MEPREFAHLLSIQGQPHTCAALVRDGHLSPMALDSLHVGRTTGIEASLLVHASLCLTTGRAELVKALLDANAVACGVNIPNSVTPLIAACQYGHIDVVELLLAHGAAATMDTENAVSGMPPALMQCFAPGSKGHGRDESKMLDCAQMLIAHRADVNRIDSAGYSNPAAATQWGDVERSNSFFSTERKSTTWVM